jgi:large subunit ribosomal protein L32
MAVPKKRTGHSAQGKRRANWKATKPETTKCPTCGETVLTHTVCTACGTYKGQPVKLAYKAAAAATAPAKKATKKSTKKAEEVKVEEVKEEVVEEVKAEETTEEKTEE